MSDINFNAYVFLVKDFLFKWINICCGWEYCFWFYFFTLGCVNGVGDIEGIKSGYVCEKPVNNNDCRTQLNDLQIKRVAIWLGDKRLTFCDHVPGTEIAKLVVSLTLEDGRQFIVRNYHDHVEINGCHMRRTESDKELFLILLQENSLQRQ